jgi:hypothetical protein
MEAKYLSIMQMLAMKPGITDEEREALSRMKDEYEDLKANENLILD